MCCRTGTTLNFERVEKKTEHESTACVHVDFPHLVCTL